MTKTGTISEHGLGLRGRPELLAAHRTGRPVGTERQPLNRRKLPMTGQNVLPVIPPFGGGVSGYADLSTLSWTAPERTRRIEHERAQL